MLLLAAVLGMASCQWVTDDLPECSPTELRVGFKYDYHMLGGDVFPYQVGALYVYLFDKDDRFVSLQTETDPALLGTHNYEMVFTDLEPDYYRLVTVAFQKSCEEMYAGAGAKFRMPSMQAGDPLEKLEVSLDRQESAKDGRLYVVHEGTPLDTLWMNRTENVVETQFQQTTCTQVDLMRLTKNLTVTLRQVNDPANISHEDFDISVTDDNGCVRHDCSLKREGKVMAYTPYASWTSEYAEKGRSEMQRAAHADMSFSRLTYSEDVAHRAVLTVRNTKTDVEVVRVDLPGILISDRNTAEQGYSAQEYLDRVHDYKLDFFLVGDTWSYINVTVGLLSWRIHNQGVGL